MGTDLQGRDQFSRILYGAQVSLQVGVIAVLMALVMGGSSARWRAASAARSTRS